MHVCNVKLLPTLGSENFRLTVISLVTVCSTKICVTLCPWTHSVFLCYCCSVKVVSDSLPLHELQHARLPCPLLFPGVCSNSCPLSPGMLSNHLILCGPLLPFPSLFPSFSISRSNEYSGLISFRIDWFDLAVQETSRIFSKTTIHQVFSAQPSLWTNSHIHTWLLEKPYFWLYDKVNILSQQSDVSAFAYTV